MRKVVVAPCLDPACGLQPPSALGRCGYWQMGRREKSQYYTSSCSNFSPLPLKWCGRRCRHRRKLEAELVMTKVNRPLDPILPAITLKWLSLLRREGKPSVVGASLPDQKKMCFVAVDSWFELLMSGREAVSRTIKSVSRSDWLFVFAPPLSEQKSLQRKRPHFAALPPQRRLFQFLPSVSTGMRLQRARFVSPPPHCADC